MDDYIYKHKYKCIMSGQYNYQYSSAWSSDPHLTAMHLWNNWQMSSISIWAPMINSISKGSSVFCQCLCFRMSPGDFPVGVDPPSLSRSLRHALTVPSAWLSLFSSGGGEMIANHSGHLLGWSQIGPRSSFTISIPQLIAAWNLICSPLQKALHPHQSWWSSFSASSFLLVFYLTKRECCLICFLQSLQNGSKLP